MDHVGVAKSHLGPVKQQLKLVAQVEGLGEPGEEKLRCPRQKENVSGGGVSCFLHVRRRLLSCVGLGALEGSGSEEGGIVLVFLNTFALR